VRPESGKKATIRKFGTRLDGIDDIDHPGVYAVIENHRKQIAVIETSNGFFLPGGGLHPMRRRRSLERESLEESGYQASVSAEIGEAVEYIKASREEMHYRFHSRFDEAQMDSKIGEGIEEDHRLVWQILWTFSQTKTDAF
jgi:8-oxo-dGTP pyrophosphatase MutT (NUDIX family)